MNNMQSAPFTWNSEVRGYELDSQGIVNNAVYLQYFDHVRIQHLLSKGIDWEKWHSNGFNLVLVHVDMELKKSLKAHDKFYVSSSIEKLGRLKIIFTQEIYSTDGSIIARAKNTVVCVSIKSGRPTMPDDLNELLFGSSAVK
jgi:acyl-CoA thioester hydrolase